MLGNQNGRQPNLDRVRPAPIHSALGFVTNQTKPNHLVTDNHQLQRPPLRDLVASIIMQRRTPEDVLEEYNTRDFFGSLEKIVDDRSFASTLAKHKPCRYKCKGCSFCHWFLEILVGRHGYEGPFEDELGFYIVVANIAFMDRSLLSRVLTGGAPVSIHLPSLAVL